jgi:hypothetical protein
VKRELRLFYTLPAIGTSLRPIGLGRGLRGDSPIAKGAALAPEYPPLLALGSRQFGESGCLKLRGFARFSSPFGARFWTSFRCVQLLPPLVGLVLFAPGVVEFHQTLKGYGQRALFVFRDSLLALLHALVAG